ncbi:MAG: hypothetical protein RSB54_00355 [Bacilli bacterium]
MNQKELLEVKKSFIIKVSVFLLILIFAGAFFLESRSYLDAVYFAAVFILFTKFLILKLYQ